VQDIGKSVLAGQIADQIIAEYPGTRVTTVRGALTVERLAETLVADNTSLVILDQFDANVTDGAITDRGLAAVLLCLAEEIAARDDQRLIITVREPLALGPRILVRQVGPRAVLSQPAVPAPPVSAPPVSAPPVSAPPVSAPDVPAGPVAGRRRPRRFWLFFLAGVLAAAVLGCAPFAVRPLVARSVPASVAVQPARTANHTERVTPPAQNPAAAAAGWLAGNVTSGTQIGCDPAMCASLSRQGLARSDLSPLHPGGDLTADGLIVVTPQARALMGSAIAAAAPELAASFGAGSGQVGIWEVIPGGAAAYPSRLAADLASRREGGNLILGNAGIRSTGNNWMVLCGGHVDSRILLALAEIAHSAPLTIASFGGANPGAAPEVPLRSVLIDIANPAAAAASLKVQNPVMQPLAVRIGPASLWIEFGAPSPIGLFQANS
jgi:hypothetical protein